MGNFAILTKADNASLGDEDPKVAYGKLSVEQKRFAKAQFIPFGDVDALVPDAYKAFVKHGGAAGERTGACPQRILRILKQSRNGPRQTFWTRPSELTLLAVYRPFGVVASRQTCRNYDPAGTCL